MTDGNNTYTVVWQKKKHWIKHFALSNKYLYMYLAYLATFSMVDFKHRPVIY